MNLLKKEIPSLTTDPANKAQTHVSSMMSAFIFIFRKVGSHFYCSNLLVNSQRRHTLFDMMRSNNYSIVSLESEILEDIYDDVDKEPEEELLARRRCIKLICIPLVFLIFFGTLTFSVVHDVQTRTRSDHQLERIV